MAGTAAAGRARALGAAWGLAAAALRDPGDGPNFREPGLREAVSDSLGALDGGLRDAGLRLLDALASEDPEDLRAEHARIFGHAVRGPCPAYEIEYGPEHFLGKSHRMGDLAGFYRAFGVEPAADAHERPDHVAMEAEFLSLLALGRDLAGGRGEEERRQICRDAERRFLEEHLGRFLPSLARRASEREPEAVLARALGFAAEVARVHAEDVGASLGSPDLGLREIGTLEEETVVSCSSSCAAPGAQEPGASCGTEV